MKRHCGAQTFFSQWVLEFALVVVLLLSHHARLSNGHPENKDNYNEEEPYSRHRRIAIRREGFRRVAIEGSSEPCFASVRRRKRQLLDVEESQLREALFSSSAKPDDARSIHQRKLQRRRLLDQHASDCIQNIRREQDQLATALLEAIPEASIVSARQKLVNVQFALIPNHVTNAQLDRILTEGATGREKASEDHEYKRNLARNPHHVVHASHDFPVVHGGMLAQQEGNDGDNSTSTTEPTTPSIFTVADYLGATQSLAEEQCLDGRGIVVAVLDSGVDYTHQVFGGDGTTEAFEAAWGSLNAETDVITPIQEAENRQKPLQRDGLFPTAVVIEGRDFLGDYVDVTNQTAVAQPDDDPIDGPEGHGTMVRTTIGRAMCGEFGIAFFQKMEISHSLYLASCMSFRWPVQLLLPLHKPSYWR